MKQYHILSKVCRQKKKYMNGAEAVIAPHRLERQFEASVPNEKRFYGCNLFIILRAYFVFINDYG